MKTISLEDYSEEEINSYRNKTKCQRIRTPDYTVSKETRDQLKKEFNRQINGNEN